MKKQVRRYLSLILAVTMLLSAVVISVPTSANAAATDGTDIYDVKVVCNVLQDGKTTRNQIVLKTKALNGAGAETTHPMQEIEANKWTTRGEDVYYWGGVGFPSQVVISDYTEDTSAYAGRLEDVWPTGGHVVEYTIAVYVKEHGTVNEYELVSQSDSLLHQNEFWKYNFVQDTYDIPTTAYPHCASVKFSESNSILSTTAITSSSIQIPTSGSADKAIYAMAYDQYNCHIVNGTNCTFGNINKAGVSRSVSAGSFSSCATITATQSANNDISDYSTFNLTANYTFNGKTGSGSITITVNNATNYVKKGIAEPTATNASVAGLSARWCNPSDEPIETIWRNNSTHLFDSGYYLQIRNNSTRIATIKSVANTNASYIGLARTKTGSSIIGSANPSISIDPGATYKLYVVNVSGTAGKTANFQSRVTIKYTLANFYDTTESLVELESVFNISVKNDDRWDGGIEVDFVTAAAAHYWGAFATWWEIDKDLAYIPASDVKEYLNHSDTGNNDATDKRAKFTIYYDVSNTPTWKDLNTRIVAFDEYKNWDLGWASRNKQNKNYFNNASDTTYYNYHYLSTTATATMKYSNSQSNVNTNPTTIGTSDTAVNANGTTGLLLNHNTSQTELSTTIYVGGTLPTNINNVALTSPSMTSSSTKTVDLITRNTLFVDGEGTALNWDAKIQRTTVITCYPHDKGDLRKALMTTAADGNKYDGGYLSCYYTNDLSSGTDIWAKYKAAYFVAREDLGTPMKEQYTINSDLDALNTAKNNLVNAYGSAYVSHYAHNSGDKNSSVTAQTDRLYRLTVNSAFTPAYLATTTYKNASKTDYIRKYSQQPSLRVTSGVHLANNTIDTPAEIHYWYIYTGDIATINGYSATEYGTNTYNEITWNKYTKTSVDAINNKLTNLKSYYSSTLTNNTYYYIPTAQSSVDFYVDNYNNAVSDKKETITVEQYAKLHTFKTAFTATMAQEEYYCNAVLKIQYDDDISETDTILGYNSATLGDLSNDTPIIAECIDASNEFDTDKPLTKHSYVYVTDTLPTNGNAGSFHYYCTTCQQVVNDTSGAISAEIKAIAAASQNVQGVYTSGNFGKSDSALPRYNVSSVAENSGSLTNAIPTATANIITARKVISAGGTEDASQLVSIPYANRGAEVKMSNISALIDSKAAYAEYKHGSNYDEYGAIDGGILEGEKQSLRFRCSMTVPDGAYVTEKGFVVAPAYKIYGGEKTMNAVTANGGTKVNIDRLVIGGASVSKMPCSNVNSDAMISANRNSFTFNIVLNINQENWARSYAARGYIKYTFGGEEYTVYDDHYSVRNVQFVLTQQANDLTKYYAHWYAVHLCKFMLHDSDVTTNQSYWDYTNSALWSGNYLNAE